MKKLFAIFTATLVVCGLCVAPAFADITNTYSAEEDQPLPYDLEYTWDDGTGAYLAFAETEDEAVSMAEQYVKDNQCETKQFSEVESGYWPDEEIVIEEAWTETVHHDAETHTEAITEEVSEGWAKCDKDGQSSYDFTGDKLIIHDGQSGYWFWAEQPMENWDVFAASTGINKADQVATARFGYDSFTFGNKTFTIKPGNISADGGISWTAWEHFKTIEVGTITVVDKEAWDETIEHPAVILYQRAAGWANVNWETIEAPEPTPVPPTPVDPEDPVIPDEPSVEPSDNPDNPILDPVVEPVVSDNGYQPVAQVSYLPKTGDHLGDLDSIIAIVITVCLAAIFVALCRKLEE